MTVPAATRRQIATLHAEGHSLAHIARTLNTTDQPTASGHPWQRSGIRRVLRGLALDADAEALRTGPGGAGRA